MKYIFIAIFFIATFFIYSTNSTKSNINYSEIIEKKIAQDYSTLSSGDIVFRTGTSFWTPFFIKANKKYGYSHLGVVIFEKNIPYILHAEADDLTLIGGIKKTLLDIFISESSSYFVKKNNMPNNLKEKFISELIKISHLNIEFDSNFDINDDGKKLYCTEYIWLAAKRAGLDNFGNIEFFHGKPFILVDSIYESSYLEALNN